MQLLVAFAHDGGPFHGVQPQPNRPTAGGALLDRLAMSGTRPRAFTLTARTDAGVHADIALATCWLPAGSVVPHQAEAPRPDGLGDVSVHRVAPTVYARGLAAAKRYVYTVRDGSVADPEWRKTRYAPVPAGGSRAWRVAESLDLDRMRTAAQRLVGQHDFTALRGPGGHTADPIKTVTRLDLERTPDGITLTVEADAFLRKMVRNIASLLVSVGRGERDFSDVDALLESRDPRQGAWTAPPHGLVLAGLHVDPAALGGTGSPQWWTSPADLATARERTTSTEQHEQPRHHRDADQQDQPDEPDAE